MEAEVLPSASGTAVLHLLTSIEEIVGPAAFAAAKSKLPAEVRAEIALVTPLHWVPVTIINEVIDAAAAEARADAEALLDRAARRATTKTFKTVWRLMLKLTTDKALIERTPIFYARSRNTGRLEAHMVSARRAEITLTEWPGISRRHIRALAVSIETVVSLAGRRDVVVVAEPTADGAVYNLTWSG